ncbi:MAG: MFS transporter [Caldilineaceae bacterium]|nr:MFS transporter [Caldilineaceae bacterium]
MQNLKPGRTLLNLQRWRHAFQFMQGNMLVLSLTNLLGNFSRAMVFPYTSLFILALGGSATQIGFINSLAPLLGLLLFPIAGYVADNAGRVRIIALSYYLSGTFLLLFILAPSWQWIAVATLLRGVMALQFPARSAIIADSLSPQQRGTGIATMNTIAGTLSIFAPYIAGAVVEWYGPNWGVRALYAAMLLLFISSGVVTQRYLKETAANADRRLALSHMITAFKEAYGGLPGLFRELPRSVLALTSVIILCFVTNGVATAFWVVYAVEEIGLSPTSWGFILLLETLVRNLLFIPGGLLVDRLGRTVALGIALILALLAMPLFVWANGFWAVLGVRILIVLAQALMIPASIALMADTVPRQMRGRVMAATGQGGVMIGAAGGGTGGPGTGFLITLPIMASSLAGGYLYAANPVYPWYVASVTMALAVVVTILFIRDPQRAEA